MAQLAVDHRAATASVLSSFVSPVRAEALAAMVAAEDPADPLRATVALVRSRYARDDAIVAEALRDAGVRAGHISRLLDVDVRTVNEWLDDERSTLPVPAPRPSSRGLAIARRAVRVTWVVVAVLFVAALVQARGGLAGCPEDLCVDRVELALADGSTLELSRDTPVVVAPDEVLAVRFHHRAPSTWTGTVRWNVDDWELALPDIRLRGVGVLTVDAPVQPLPEGAHRVEVVDGPDDAVAVFQVQG